MIDFQIPEHLREHYERVMGYQTQVLKLKGQNCSLKLKTLLAKIPKASTVFHLKGARNKLAIIALAILLLFGPAAYFLARSPRGAEAAWWNDSWLYRKSISITNSSGSTLTEFQVKALDDYDTSALVTAGKMQSDCDDIRFTDLHGKPLPYWIESGCNTSTTDVWVKIPTINGGSGNTTTTIYLYYGNPSASSYQSGNDTFEFFDDFESSSLDTDKWTLTQGHSVSSGLLTLDNGKSSSDSSADYVFAGNNKFRINQEVRVREKSSATNKVNRFGVTDDVVNFFTGGHYNIMIQKYSNGYIYTDVNDGSTNTQTQESTYDTNYHVYRFKWVSGSIKYYEDTSEIREYTTSLPNDGDPLYPILRDDSITDWIFVRKTTATEPTAGSPGSEEESEGPVAYWKFDEGYGSTAYDETLNNNDGNLGTGSSAPSWQSEDMCLSGKCLKFDGSNDYVDAGNNSSLNLTGNTVTYETWIKVNETLSSSQYRTILVKSNAAGAGWHGLWYVNGSSDGVTCNNGFLFGLNGTWLVCSSTSPEVGKWYHIVGRYNGSTVKIYVNGVEESTASYSTSMGSTSSNQYIGRRNDGYYLNGFVDEVKIYPYARSAAQIKADYLGGAGSHGAGAVMGKQTSSSEALSEGLVGYWEMDEASWNGTPDEVIDSSGNGNHGVGVGATPPTTTAGVFGNGGIFDGSEDYVDGGTGTSLNFPSGQGFAFTAWVKTSDGYGQIVSFRNSSTGNPVIDLAIGYNGAVNTSGHLIPIMRYDDNTGLAYFSSTSAINDNNWHFIAFTYNPADQKIYAYVDTSQWSTNQTSTGSITTNLRAVASERYWAQVSFGTIDQRYLNGQIDEVRIYNRALSAQEVQNLYLWAPGPIAHLTFDEHSGSTAYDVSGNSNNGSLGAGSSAPEWTTGKFGGGLKFDGNDYVTVADNSTLDITDAVTVEAWVNTSSYAWDNDTQPVGVGGSCCGNESTILSQIEDDDDTWNSNWIVCSCSYLGDTPMTVDYTVTDYDFVTDATLEFESVRSGSGATMDITCGGASHTDYFLQCDGGDCDNWLPPDGINTIAIPTECFEDNTYTVRWARAGSNCLKFDYMYVNYKHSAAIKKENAYGLTSTDSNSYGAINGNGLSTSTSSGWNHVAFTYDKNASSNQQKLYINGVLKNQGTLTDSINTNANDLIVGSSLIGLIDDVRIYNYARTPAQIREDMLGRSQGGLSAGGRSGMMNAPRDSYTPVAHWRFDEGYGSIAYDESPNNNNGTLSVGSSAPSWDNDGKFGKALSFDGGDYVDTNSGTSLDFTGSISFSAWVNTNTVTGGLRRVLGKMGAGGSPGRAYTFQLDDGKVGISIASDASTVVAHTGQTTVNTSQWYHIAGVYNAEEQTMDVYLNAVKDASTKTADVPSSQFTDNGLDVQIGQRGDGLSYFDGIIDEVKIYNYALSEDEVKLEYNRSASMVMGALGTDSSGNVDFSSERSYCVPGDATSCSDPVAEWKLDDKTGMTANDTSENGNTGTLTNMEVSDWQSASRCKKGACLEFDGNNEHVAVSDDPTLSSTNKTLEAWVKLNKLGTNDLVAGKGAESWLAYNFTNAGCTANRFSFAVYDGDWQCANNSTQPNAGQWYYLVGTYDGSNVRLYVNGILDGGPTAQSNPSDTANAFGIGSYPGEPTTYALAGKVDHVVLYNYARSPAQIAWDYNRGAPVGHWRLDEGEGGTAYDEGDLGNSGNDGSINIGASGSQTTVAVAWSNGETGKINRSLNFDGTDDYIQITSADSLKLSSSDATFTAWVYPQSSGADDVIIGNNFSAGWAFTIWDGKIGLFTGGTTYSDLAQANTTLPTTQWSHIVAVWDNSTKTASFYLNGKDDGSEANANGIGNGGNTFYIAVDSRDGSGFEFDGQIDDVRIYNYAFTEAQIKQAYNAGAAVRYAPATGSP